MCYIKLKTNLIIYFLLNNSFKMENDYSKLFPLTSKLNKYLIKIIQGYNDQNIYTLITIYNEKFKNRKNIYDNYISILDLLSKCVKLGYSGFYISKAYNSVIKDIDNIIKKVDIIKRTDHDFVVYYKIKSISDPICLDFMILSDNMC